MYVAFAIQATACSLDYSQVTVSEEMSEQVPDSILHEFSYTVVEGGKPSVRVDAERAEFFEKSDRTYVTGLTFREYDEQGELVTEGTADYAEFHTDTESAELEGGLRFYSSTEEATVETEYLYWDNEEKLLTGREDDRVRIEEDSGSRLDGIGFEADVRRRLIDFAGPVSGRFVSDSDE